MVNMIDFAYLARMKYFEKMFLLETTKIQVINLRCVIRYIDMGGDEEMDFVE